MTYGFVILHYNVMEETLTCIESIKKHIKNETFHIVVVDNKSPNNSGNDLKKKFLNDDCVTIILNDENLGFANGNNVGIRYARDILKVDFVVVLNNDTYLLQDDFSRIIETEWNRSHFAVLGPRIETPSGINQNPVPYAIRNKRDICSARYYWYTGLLRTLIGIDKIWLEFKAFLKRILGEKKVFVDINERREDVKLHGSCWIFSPTFFQHFNGLDDRTFMYLEEDILWNQVLKAGLHTIYNPQLKIFHAEDAATNSIRKNWRSKSLFFYRQHLKSIKILEKVLNECCVD